MPYLVMELVDRDFDIVNTCKEARELADYYERTMTEYAIDNGEWPTGSRILITKVIEDRFLEYKEEEDYFELVVKRREEDNEDS